jgi:2-keto-4-pentenoate hydratase/2-oxohepta-3-ene-1,7-dioic acid hydratase in catechol pathway
MRLVTVRTAEGQLAPGVLVAGGQIVDISVFGFESVLALIEAGPAELEPLGAAVGGAVPRWSLSDDGITLAPPITRTPRNMFCIGVNYRSHFDEGDRPDGTAIPDAPVIFTKPWTCLVGDGATVVVDRGATNRLDWEAELAVVIGRGGRNIALEDALDHVFGYSLANDLSARDLQLEHGMFGQWFKGKSLDGFCPMGPTLVTADEIGDYRGLSIRLFVNEQLKQDFATADMLNDIERIISRLSLGMELLPGDVILTGTAAGVGHWRKPPEFLGGGDVVRVECDELGTLTTVIAE